MAVVMYRDEYEKQYEAGRVAPGFSGRIVIVERPLLYRFGKWLMEKFDYSAIHRI